MVLEIKDLHASIVLSEGTFKSGMLKQQEASSTSWQSSTDQNGNKTVLRGINLKINPGEVHAIMGPNGSGKSSLSKIIAGHSGYVVDRGAINYEINYQMKDLLSLDATERAREGVFLAFQYPVEVPGVSNFYFLQTALNSVLKHHGSAELDDTEFRHFLKKKMELLEFKEEFLNRSVNSGFSGGEKKRNEILQMAVLGPRLMLLDEIDSGLDIDSLRVISHGVNKVKNASNAVVMITHYQRLLDYIRPDFVHVLLDGKIVETGGPELALQLEKRGYDWLKTQ